MTPRVRLTLFVAGASSLSSRAIGDTQRMCELHLRDDYELSVVDLSVDSGNTDRVMAAPTLRRTRPLPERQIVGDLSDMRKVLVALELGSG